MSAEQIEWERMRTSTLLLNTAHKSSWLQCKKGVCRRGNNQWLLLVQESNVLSCLQSKQSGSGWEPALCCLTLRTSRRACSARKVCAVEEFHQCLLLAIEWRSIWLARIIYIYIYIRFTYGIFGLEITKYTVYLYVYIRFWPTLKKRRVVMAVEQIHIVGQNRIYAPYMTVYLIESLPKTPYIHRIYMVLVNPRRKRSTIYYILVCTGARIASSAHRAMGV